MVYETPKGIKWLGISFLFIEKLLLYIRKP